MQWAHAEISLHVPAAGACRALQSRCRASPCHLDTSVLGTSRRAENACRGPLDAHCSHGCSRGHAHFRDTTCWACMQSRANWRGGSLQRPRHTVTRLRDPALTPPAHTRSRMHRLMLSGSSAAAFLTRLPPFVCASLDSCAAAWHACTAPLVNRIPLRNGLQHADAPQCDRFGHCTRAPCGMNPCVPDATVS